MTQQTNWLPGLIVLAVTFVAAALFLLLNRRKVVPSPEVRDGARDDLERRAQLLIEQLKALETEKHGLGEEQYAAERSRLELEAAAAFRARDEYRQRQDTPARRPAPLAPAPTGFAGRHPQLMGALWGASIVLFFGTLGYLLVSEQRERAEGETATGKVPPGAPASSSPALQQQEREFEEARQRLRDNPADLDSASLVAHVLIQRQELEEAATLTDKSLAQDPFHIESRVHRGVLRAARGDVPGAEQELTELVNTWPDTQEALLVLGAISMRAGNLPKALDYFERFAAETPRQMQPPQLLGAIQELRRQVASASQQAP